MRSEWTNISDGLPTKFMRVQLIFKTSKNTCIGRQHYFFDPKDNSFRTPRGNNKAHKVLMWIPSR